MSFKLKVLGVAGAGIAIAGALLFLDGSTKSLLDAVTHLGSPPPPAVVAPPNVNVNENVTTSRTLAREAHGAWRIDGIIPSSCKVDEPCEVTLMLMPSFGWHANREYPTKFVVTAAAAKSETLSFVTQSPGPPQWSRSTGSVEHLEDGTARIHVIVAPRTAGQHRLSGRLRVSACDEELCRIDAHDLEIDLDAS